MTVVAPAGNAGGDVPHYPAALESVIAVGAVDHNGQPTAWTSYGEWVDIMAPGGTPVVAVTTGRVLKLFRSDKGGITLYQLDPDGRTVYYYAHLAGYAPGIVEGKLLLLLQALGQAAAFDGLHHQVHQVVLLTDEVQRDDVRV